MHRHLKPANTLVTKAGVKLLDLGLAKLEQPEVRAADIILTTPLTGHGQIVGTLNYMAPEQLEGKEADARSDIFAFGLALYEQVGAKILFRPRTTSVLMTPANLPRLS